MFDGIEKAAAADRYAFLMEFFKNFYNLDVLQVSKDAVHASWIVAAGSCPIATAACVPAWLEDFRDDLQKIDVPTCG